MKTKQSKLLIDDEKLYAKDVVIGTLVSVGQIERTMYRVQLDENGDKVFMIA